MWGHFSLASALPHFFVALYWGTNLLPRFDATLDFQGSKMRVFLLFFGSLALWDVVKKWRELKLTPIMGVQQKRPPWLCKRWQRRIVMGLQLFTHHMARETILERYWSEAHFWTFSYSRVKEAISCVHWKGHWRPNIRWHLKNANAKAFFRSDLYMYESFPKLNGAGWGYFSDCQRIMNSTISDEL